MGVDRTCAELFERTLEDLRRMDGDMGGSCGIYKGDERSNHPVHSLVRHTLGSQTRRIDDMNQI